MISFTRREHLLSLVRWNAVFWGACLGLVNFGSIYFLVKALDHHDPVKGIIDSSVIFGINNIGIVSLSVLLGILLFREKLSKVNAAGMALCITAIIILAYSV